MALRSPVSLIKSPSKQTIFSFAYPAIYEKYERKQKPSPRNVSGNRVLSPLSLSVDEFSNSFSNFHKVDYLGYRLPGSGEKCSVDCGKWMTKGCLNVEAHPKNQVYVKHFKKSHYDSSCPSCWRTWLVREANRMTQRIEKFVEISKKPAKHIMISPPLSLHYTTLSSLRKIAYARLKEVGCYGGVMIFHAYRQNKTTTGDWYFSPHFHVVGFGWIRGYHVSNMYQREGWVVKNIGIRKSVFGLCHYQLSHATIVKGRHAVTLFGSLSYRNVQLKAEDVSQKSICPYCSEPLEELLPTVKGKPPPDEFFEGLVDPDLYFAPKVCEALYYRRRG